MVVKLDRLTPRVEFALGVLLFAGDFGRGKPRKRHRVRPPKHHQSLPKAALIIPVVAASQGIVSAHISSASPGDSRFFDGKKTGIPSRRTTFQRALRGSPCVALFRSFVNPFTDKASPFKKRLLRYSIIRWRFGRSPCLQPAFQTCSASGLLNRYSMVTARSARGRIRTLAPNKYPCRMSSLIESASEIVWGTRIHRARCKDESSHPCDAGAHLESIRGTHISVYRRRATAHFPGMARLKG